jgi:hypothetical protein
MIGHNFGSDKINPYLCGVIKKLVVMTELILNNRISRPKMDALLTFLNTEDTIVLVDIYDKNERESMTKKEYKTILHDFLQNSEK